MEDDATAAAAAAEDAKSMVFRLDELLIEILLRVDFPTTLVRAAAVCKRWYHHASDQNFLRRFHKLNPPRLLGFYMHGYPDDSFLSSVCPQRFVPVLHQPPELLAAVRTVQGYSFPAQEYTANVVAHCSNGRVFTFLCDALGYQFFHEVHSPFCPGSAAISINPGLTFLPRPPAFGFDILTREEEDGSLSYFYVFMEFAFNENGPATEWTACVYMLQDGIWRKHTTATPRIPCGRVGHSLLVQNTVYMTVTLIDITVLDLSTSSFSTVHLPDGVQHPCSDFMLSRAPDDSSVYLVELKDFQLRIWLYKGGSWSVVDTFLLLEMCANLMISDCTVEDAHTSPQIKHVGDYAQFVLLQMGRHVWNLDTRCRTLCTLYEMTAEEQAMESINIIPIMTRPPTFPSLRNLNVKK
ncbi:hypothetical protein ACQJBY_058764 [Aegilops geniculata]